MRLLNGNQIFVLIFQIWIKSSPLQVHSLVHSIAADGATVANISEIIRRRADGEKV